MTWWYCADQTDGEKFVWIEADRWFDARRTAWTLLGSEKLWVTHPKTEQTRPPKNAYKDHKVYVAKWVGSAYGANDLHMEVTRVLVRKLVCECCHRLLWPWELQEAGGKLIHPSVDGSVCPSCGPVVERRRHPEPRSPSSLPEAQPYEDELPHLNGSTP